MPKALNVSTNSDLQEEQIQKLVNAISTDYEMNSDEVVHTGNTGAGKELIPLNVMMQKYIDQSVELSRLLPLLPGNHGTDMPISATVPVIGEIGTFEGNSEWEDDDGTNNTGTNGQKKLPTDKITINQGSFIAQVPLSKRELNYAPQDLQKLVADKLALAMAHTIDAFIINADSVATATGNVNSDDATPPTKAYYKEGDNGIRKLGLGLAAGAGSYDIGTPDDTDFLAMIQKMGDFYDDPSQLLFVMNSPLWTKIQGLYYFKDAAKRGGSSTIGGVKAGAIYSVDMVTSRWMPKTEADGKVSVTPTSNVKGSCALIYKPAIQYGFGQNFELDFVKIPGKGIRVVATFEFGFAIANQLAGRADPTVVYGYNATL